MRKRPVRLSKYPSAGALALLAGIAVSSCTTESQLGPIGTQEQPSVAAGVGAGNATSAEQLRQAGINCPGVTIRSGASAWQVPPGSGPTEVRYQGTIGQLARECALLGETMTMRVGVEGRVLVGPQGGAGELQVPVRIALVEEGPQPKPVWSKFYSVTVTIPPNTSQAIFSHVEDDLTFPLPADRQLGNYVVYVGFDPQGAAGAPRAAKSKARPRAPAPKAAAAPAPRAAPRQRPAAQPKQEPQEPQQPQFEPPPQQQPQFDPPPSPPSGVFAPPPGQSG